MPSPSSRPGRLVRTLTHLGRWMANPLGRFAGNRRGNVLIIFGVSALPLIGSLGVGVEYLRKANYRARLDDAADAAVMAAITTARDYIATNPNNETDPTASAIGLGKTRAAAMFRANSASTLGAVAVTPTITLTRTGQDLVASVSYTTVFASPFGRLLGNVAASSLNVGGISSSSLTIGTYADFYLLLDTSGSMGFPTDAKQQNSFAKLNPDNNNGKPNNCAFACHFPTFSGYAISKANNIELRIKTVGNAVLQLIDTAKNNTTLTDQFRIGIYPFVSRLETANSITPNLDSLKTNASNLENYMDVGNSALERGSGGTHYEIVLPAIGNKVTRFGDGSSSAQAKSFVFLVTDGVSNNQYFNGNYPSGWWTGSQPGLLNTSDCTALKNKKITLSILYVPYVPIQTIENADAVVKRENEQVNGLIPSVPNKLKECASPGYFYTASSAAEITAALQAMFQQAIKVARLTK